MSKPDVLIFAPRDEPASMLAEVEQACAGYTAAAADLITLVRMETDLAVSAKHLAAQKKTGEISALESARLLIDPRR